MAHSIQNQSSEVSRHATSVVTSVLHYKTLRGSHTLTYILHIQKRTLNVASSNGAQPQLTLNGSLAVGAQVASDSEAPVLPAHECKSTVNDTLVCEIARSLCALLVSPSACVSSQQRPGRAFAVFSQFEPQRDRYPFPQMRHATHTIATRYMMQTAGAVLLSGNWRCIYE